MVWEWSPGLSHQFGYVGKHIRWLHFSLYKQQASILFFCAQFFILSVPRTYSLATLFFSPDNGRADQHQIRSRGWRLWFSWPSNSCASSKAHANTSSLCFRCTNRTKSTPCCPALHITDKYQVYPALSKAHPVVIFHTASPPAGLTDLPLYLKINVDTRMCQSK